MTFTSTPVAGGVYLSLASAPRLLLSLTSDLGSVAFYT